MSKKIRRVLIVDGDPQILRRWRAWLESAGNFVVTAASLSEARRALRPASRGLHPFDSLVIEISLADGSGLDLLEEASILKPAPALAIISDYIDNSLILALTRRQVCFLAKPVTTAELLELVGDWACRGFTCDSPTAARKSVQSYADTFQLTPRERQMLDGCIAGHSREQTALALGISVGTVHRTWDRILRRTGNPTQEHVLRHLIRHVTEGAVHASARPPQSSGVHRVTARGSFELLESGARKASAGHIER